MHTINVVQACPSQGNVDELAGELRQLGTMLQQALGAMPSRFEHGCVQTGAFAQLLYYCLVYWQSQALL